MAERFLEFLYDVLLHPGTAMRTIAAQKMVCEAVVVFSVSLFIPAWMVYLVLKALGLGKMAGIAVAVQSAGCLVFWILGAALFSLCAEFMGGKGTALGLLSSMGFAYLPRIFIAPLFVVAVLATGGLAKVFMTLSGVAIFFWVLILDIEALKGAYALSTARAIVAMLIPFAILFLTVLIGILVISISMIHLG